MDEMSLNLGIIAIAGIVASLLTSVVSESWWTKARKQWVSFGVSVGLGTIALIIDGFITHPPSEPLELLGWVAGTVAAVAAASQVVYAQFSEKLKVLEETVTARRAVARNEDHND